MRARAEPANLEGALVGGRYRVGPLVRQSDATNSYAAEHVQLGSRVAFEVLRRGDAVADAESSDRAFFAKVRALFAVRHPNVVTALDQGNLDAELGGLPYLVLAWVEGERLSTLLGAADAKPVTAQQAWTELRPIVDAVAHLHERGIVHGDLAATHIVGVLGPSGALHRLVLTDLGPTRPCDSPEPRRARHTPAFAAPEHVDARPLGPATDVHGLGLLFLALLARTEPYRGDPRRAAIDPVRPSATQLGVDAGPFEEVLTKSLALSEQDRFADARAFQRAMDAAAAALETPPSEARVEPRAPVEARRWKAPPIVWAAAAALLASIAGGAAWLALRSSTGPNVATLRRPPRPDDPLDALTEHDLQSRLTARGLRVSVSTANDSSIGVSALTPGKVSVLLQLVPAPSCDEADVGSCAVALRDALLRSHRPTLAQGHSLLYASGGRRVLLVSSQSVEEAESAWSAVIDGMALEVRGRLSPGDVPTKGLRARTLASLGPAQLTTQLEQAGLEVTWAGSAGDGILAMAVYRDGTSSSAAYVYRGDVAAIAASVAAMGEPCAWAESSGHLLVLRGDSRLATRDVLSRVIVGLDAQISGSSP